MEIKKKLIFLGQLACIVLILLMASCGGSKYPLNGMWVNDSGGLNLAFVDDIVFLEFSYGNNTYVYRHDPKTTEIVSKRNTLSFDVVGDEMRLNLSNTSYDFKKNKEQKPVANTINGIWRSDNNTTIVFINDKAYVFDSEEDKANIVNYSFDKNKGMTKSRQFDATFTVKGKTLTAIVKGMDDPLVFNRVK